MAEQHLISTNETAKRFEYSEKGLTAFIEYRFQKHSIAFLHTEVPKELSGKGIAAELTVYAFKYAKEHQLSVINYCPYIDVYLKRHPDLNEQLDKE